MADDDEFFKHAVEDLFPKMKGSALNIVIVAEPDPKLCMEVGAAILFDKPIILLVPPGRMVSAALRRAASVIVQGDMQDPTTGERLQSAITRVLENDARAKGAKK